MKLSAIYEQDGLFYNAEVQSIEDDGTITVFFTDYNHPGQVRRRRNWLVAGQILRLLMCRLPSTTSS